MDYRIVDRIHINKDECEKIGAFLYHRKKDGLYFESPWPFPVQLYIGGGLNHCLVTPMFIKLPFILKGWINLDILLREIELLKLVAQGKILMHASCVDNTLVVGLPNAGKTYQTYSMVRDGGKLISEEYTIISGTTASPYKPVMRTCFSRKTIEHCRIKICWKERIALWLAEIRAWLMPFMFEGAIWKNIPASGDTAEIKKIVYGSTGREVKDWREFAILCENEFPFMSSEFLQAYAIASGLDLIAIQNKQRELIKEFVNAIYPGAQS